MRARFFLSAVVLKTFKTRESVNRRSVEKPRQRRGAHGKKRKRHVRGVAAFGRV